MSTIRCRKCGAGRGSLEPIVEHLEGGVVLQTVRCILCGERRSRMVTRYTDLMPPEDMAVRSGRRCEVVGCNVELSDNNKTGLCKKHGGALHNWQHSKRTKPAPYIQTAEGWIPNPAREVNHAHV